MQHSIEPPQALVLLVSNRGFYYTGSLISINYPVVNAIITYKLRTRERCRRRVAVTDTPINPIPSHSPRSYTKPLLIIIQLYIYPSFPHI